MTKLNCLSRRGFTLIELLIVISILSILVLLGYPRLIEFRTDALVGEIQGTGTVIGRAAEAWMASHADEVGSFNQAVSLDNYLKGHTLAQLDDYTVTVDTTGVQVTYIGSMVILSSPVVYNTSSN